jgi:hypothetical protein
LYRYVAHAAVFSGTSEAVVEQISRVKVGNLHIDCQRFLEGFACVLMRFTFVYGEVQRL